MSIEYAKVDWETCLLAIMPTAQYTGHQVNPNESGFMADITWTDARAKPTWGQIIDKWTHPTNTGSGVNHNRHSPGDRKLSALAVDHGDWLYVHPTNGRTLDKVTYAMLYKVIGDAYSGAYSGIAGTDFGLPKGIGGRVWLVTNDTYPYGSMAGEASHAITTAEMPAHSHGLNANILVAGVALAIGGLTALLGTLVTKITPTTTSSAGTGTPMSLMQPYVSFGNLFIYRGQLKYDLDGGTYYY